MNKVKKIRFFGSAPASVKAAVIVLMLTAISIFICFCFGLFSHQHPTGSTYRAEVLPFVMIALLTANLVILPYRYPDSSKYQSISSLFGCVIAMACVTLVLNANKDAAEKVRVVTNAMELRTLTKEQGELLVASQQTLAEICALSATINSSAVKQACARQES